jgi:hypothetical protein
VITVSNLGLFRGEPFQDKGRAVLPGVIVLESRDGYRENKRQPQKPNDIGYGERVGLGKDRSDREIDSEEDDPDGSDIKKKENSEKGKALLFLLGLDYVKAFDGWAMHFCYYPI